MIDRLPPHDETGRQRDFRGELDSALGVSEWYTPRTVKLRTRVSVADGAPGWWHGDEEASSSFLRSMGVNLGAG